MFLASHNSHECLSSPFAIGHIAVCVFLSHSSYLAFWEIAMFDFVASIRFAFANFSMS